MQNDTGRRFLLIFQHTTAKIQTRKQEVTTRVQRMCVGLYRITPGHSDLYGDNTPGITALNRTTAGEPAPLRTHVWIHYAWGNTNAGAETKGCLAFIDRQNLIIQRAMLDQKKLRWGILTHE